MKEYEVIWRDSPGSEQVVHVVEGYSVGDVVAGLYTGGNKTVTPPPGISRLIVREVFG